MLPHASKHEYVNDYVPEPGWQMWQAMARSRGSPHYFPLCGVDRDRFLRAYARVYRQLRPRVPLCLPRRYLALHIRGGDKGDLREGAWSGPRRSPG